MITVSRFNIVLLECTCIAMTAQLNLIFKLGPYKPLMSSNIGWSTIKPPKTCVKINNVYIIVMHNRSCLHILVCIIVNFCSPIQCYVWPWRLWVWSECVHTHCSTSHWTNVCIDYVPLSHLSFDIVDNMMAGESLTNGRYLINWTIPPLVVSPPIMPMY